MNIRIVTAHDFYYVRRLPLQLAKRTAYMLAPKTLRRLMVDADVRLLVYERSDIAAFLALRVIPPEPNALHFLEIVHFAIDRFAVSNGVACAMIEKATQFAAELGCAGLLALNEELSEAALHLYEQSGFTQLENTLMKRTIVNELASL